MLEEIKNIINLTFTSEFLNSIKPVLLYFWAPWCEPCKNFLHIFNEISKNFKKILKFIKLNVDENFNIVKKYNIRSVPTLILFKKGKICFQKSGFLSKRELISLIKENI